MRALGLAAAILVVATVVRAESRDDFQARGEALGRVGKWGEAVAQFKAAERIEHRAIHACLIALAYARREAWPQAEVFLARCRDARDEAMPDWVRVAERLIREHLVPLAAVTIDVVPPDASPTLTASSFEPDETFTPSTIHLPRGTHVIVARAPGYREQSRVVVVPDGEPRHVVIDMRATPVPPEPRYASTLRITGLAAAGLGVAAAGVGIELGRVARRDADTLTAHVAGTPWTAQDHQRYDAGRTANREMVGAYVTGAALVVTGGVLYYLGARSHVAPAIDSHTASIAVVGAF
jgi:hypothetical protein